MATSGDRNLAIDILEEAKNRNGMPCDGRRRSAVAMAALRPGCLQMVAGDSQKTRGPCSDVRAYGHVRMWGVRGTRDLQAYANSCYRGSPDGMAVRRTGRMVRGQMVCKVWERRS